MKPREPETGKRALQPTARRIGASAIIASAALAHLLPIGSFLDQPLRTYYSSYFSDIVIPFSAYFILCLSEERVALVRDWRWKVVTVLGAASLAEVMQGMGVPLLGRTFDPLDFIMYGAGVSAAALFEHVVFGMRELQ